jgi:hypothetical protein
MNELMVLLQGRGSNTDKEFFFDCAAKTIAGSHMRVAMGDFMVWA